MYLLREEDWRGISNLFTPKSYPIPLMGTKKGLPNRIALDNSLKIQVVVFFYAATVDNFPFCATNALNSSLLIPSFSIRLVVTNTVCRFCMQRLYLVICLLHHSATSRKVAPSFAKSSPKKTLASAKSLNSILVFFTDTPFSFVRLRLANFKIPKIFVKHKYQHFKPSSVPQTFLYSL